MKFDYELVLHLLIILLVGAVFVSMTFETKYRNLKEDYCWLNLHTYEDFLDDEPSNSTTIGDVFMYLDFKELRKDCKREGYHPNRFTEISEVNEKESLKIDEWAEWKEEEVWNCPILLEQGRYVFSNGILISPSGKELECVLLQKSEVKD